MITFLSGYMSLRLAKVVGYVLVPLLILGAFYLALDAYGDSRFREGRKAENAAWQAAQDKLLKDAAQSAAIADRQDLARKIEHSAQVQEEKEKIDEAIANGSSPFDVLFPSDGVRAPEGS